MKDDKLFKLCQEVYEIFPSWLYEKNDKDIWFTKDEYGEIDTTPYIVDNCCWLETDEELVAPLYTSDYLLEKLKAFKVCVFNDTENGEVQAYIEDNDETFNTSDTTLKSLLKLILSLHESGHLNNG